MANNGMPKLLCAWGKAKIYEAPLDEVALFWGIKPVALFSDVGSAVNYLYNEFGPLDKDIEDEDKGGFMWVI